MGVPRLSYLLGLLLLAAAPAGCAGSQATRPTSSPVYDAPLASEPVTVQKSQVAAAPAVITPEPSPVVPPPPAAPEPAAEAQPEQAEK